MNRGTVIFVGFCVTTLVLSFCAARSLTSQSANTDLPTPALPVVSNWVSKPAEAPKELHPYVESLRTARAQGTVSQIRNEMRLLAEYCNEHPGNLGDVLHDLSVHAAQDPMLRIFGEVLLKGRGQPVDRLIEQTATVWSRETQDRAQRQFGLDLLEVSHKTKVPAPATR